MSKLTRNKFKGTRCGLCRVSLPYDSQFYWDKHGPYGRKSFCMACGPNWEKMLQGNPSPYPSSPSSPSSPSPSPSPSGSSVPTSMGQGQQGQNGQSTQGNGQSTQSQGQGNGQSGQSGQSMQGYGQNGLVSTFEEALREQEARKAHQEQEAQKALETEQAIEDPLSILSTPTTPTTPTSTSTPTLPPDITDNIKVTGKHNRTAYIRLKLRARQYPFLYGAPGAGKTHLIESMAQDMGLDFALLSCSPDMFKSEIIGSRSPVSGEYFSTAFRKIWENGGVVLFDEVGLASGSFINILNAGLAQRKMQFPDGNLVPMHEHTFIVFADNSALYGNDPLFPERQDVGQAFRDRIAYVEFTYDTELEYTILVSIFAGDKRRAKKWHRTVLSLRQSIAALSVPVFASPRFAFDAAKMLVLGESYNEVIESYLIRGIGADIRTQISRIVTSEQGVY